MELSGYDHATGRHCGSTSLSNLARYYDWGLDEATCFGLASGLGFTFFELDDSPHRAFFGRPVYLERAFFHTLAVPHEEREGADWADAWADIRSRVDDGHPVLVFTDIYDLDYFDTDTHFAPHSLLVVGYEDDEVLLSDSEFDEPQRLPVERLRAAMNSRAMVPLNNRYITVTDPELGTDLDTAIEDATVEMARSMLRPGGGRFDPGPVGVHGLAGIQRLVSDMASWTQLPDPAWTTRFAYQNVERRGTGGGAFRGLQRDFFRTVDHPFGEETTQEMAAIADDWTAVGETLKEASEADDDRDLRDGIDEAAGEIRQLADREARLYQSILDTAN
ncbi:BtrH N-terminal domain-containing protein [Halomarina rubra]|uniref:BtrH N-terminal domain-containing protein n=1 Tax=Halomarina rubra TaxID=2071873 RepID=A0ABD6AVK4_9EURY|nr:BtrH N-terminal domain-containing protein [Halomarina rubra]